MIEHLERYKLIKGTQHGFVRNKSCSSAIFVLQDLMQVSCTSFLQVSPALLMPVLFATLLVGEFGESLVRVCG